MPERGKWLPLAGVAVALGCAFTWLAGASPAAGSAAAPAPSPSASPGPAPSGAPIQVILPSPAAPSDSLGAKDFLVPLATFLGAAIGFFGAVTGARLAATAQDKRSRHEAEIKRREEENARTVRRLEAFADQATGLMGYVAPVAYAKAEAWRAETTALKEDLRLRAAQMLGSRHLLDTDLEKSVREFVGSIMDIVNAPNAAQAKQAAPRCGEMFEALMAHIGQKLRAQRPPA